MADSGSPDRKEKKEKKERVKKDSKAATLLDELITEAEQDERRLEKKERKKESKRREKEKGKGHDSHSEAGSINSGAGRGSVTKGASGGRQRRQHATIKLDHIDDLRGSLKVATRKPSIHASSSNNNSSVSGGLFSYFDIIGEHTLLAASTHSTPQF